MLDNHWEDFIEDFYQIIWVVKCEAPGIKQGRARRCPIFCVERLGKTAKLPLALRTLVDHLFVHKIWRRRLLPAQSRWHHRARVDRRVSATKLLRKMWWLRQKLGPDLQDFEPSRAKSLDVASKLPVRL